MKTVQREIVSALILSKDGKLLMVEKDPSGGGVYIDCWHLPGGGIHQGESQTDALRREIKEEVGIDILPDQIELVDDEGKGVSERTSKDTGEKIMIEMNFNVYEVVVNDSSSEIEIKLDKELSEYKWFALDELRTVKLTLPSIKLFTKLGYLKK